MVVNNRKSTRRQTKSLFKSAPGSWKVLIVRQIRILFIIEVNGTQSIAQLKTTYQSRLYFEQPYLIILMKSQMFILSTRQNQNTSLLKLEEKNIVKFFFWFKRKNVNDQLWCSKNQNFIVFFLQNNSIIILEKQTFIYWVITLLKIDSNTTRHQKKLFQKRNH